MRTQDIDYTADGFTGAELFHEFAGAASTSSTTASPVGAEACWSATKGRA